MVWNFGMGASSFIGDFASMPKEQISESLKDRLNTETQDLLHKAMAEVEATLKAEWHIVQRFANELLKKDELDYDEIAAIFIEYGKPPKLPAGVRPALPAEPPPALLPDGEASPSNPPRSKPPFA